MKKHESSDGVELTYQGPGATGSIYAKRDPENTALYRVTRVWAKPEGQGHGKKLYMAAMEFVTAKGGMLAPAKNSTSDSASNVWRSLYASPETQKTPLHARDWPDTPRNKSMVAKYPGLRLADPGTYPPKTDAEFWAFNSGYRLSRSANANINASRPKKDDELSLEII